MKYTIVTLMICFVIPFSMNLSAEEKLRVLDKGIDGNHRTYLVTCPDGGYSSVVQKFHIADNSDKPSPDHDLRLARGNTVVQPRIIEVCIHPREGDDICRSSWDIDEAAQASCR